jgi:uncharacterized protein
MKRLYHELITYHFEQYHQMLFIAGPRQVGKTTLAHAQAGRQVHYLNWDLLPDREVILKLHHQGKLDFALPIAGEKPLLIFDELHKYPQWKPFLKGYFDRYHQKINILVTGSARLDIYQKGGDSLMGRYFLSRMHPLSVRELNNTSLPITEIQAPVKISPEQMEALLVFGGFPENYVKQSQQFSNNWQRLRYRQLFQEDIRELTKVHEIASLEVLAEMIKINAAKNINLTKLASKMQVAATSIKRWLAVLHEFYFCFSVKPWHKNISRSLMKEPKCYLWNWAEVADKGAKHENFIASHLLKAVHFWTDFGFGSYGLFYIRTIDKQEVDFVVTKNDEPWMLVEVKSASGRPISKALHHFQQVTKAPYAFQVAFDMPYKDINCFDYREPVVVPVSTFLSQLV